MHKIGSTSEMKLPLGRMKVALGQNEYIVSFRLETFRRTHFFWRTSMAVLTVAEDGSLGIVLIILIAE
jgi:hypothetical protein